MPACLPVYLHWVGSIGLFTSMGPFLTQECTINDGIWLLMSWMLLGQEGACGLGSGLAKPYYLHPPPPLCDPARHKDSATKVRCPPPRPSGAVPWG